jgi:hypothetical protein
MIHGPLCEIEQNPLTFLAAAILTMGLCLLGVWLCGMKK